MIHLDKDEHVIHEIRRPRVLILVNMATMVLLAFLPLLLYPRIVNGLYRAFEIHGSIQLFFLFLYCVWLLLLWMIFFAWWIDYYLTVWILTDSRIFCIRRTGLVTRVMTSYRLEDIAEANVIYPNVFSRSCGIGNLAIHSFPKDSLIAEEIFTGAFEPEKARDLIKESSRLRKEKFSTVSFTIATQEH
jgi:hypothetical protein